MRVRVRNRPGVLEHRRAGIDFGRDWSTHDVSAEQLKKLQGDDVLEIEQTDHEVGDGLEAMTVPQLRSAAREAGLHDVGKLHKAELIEAIRAGAAGDDDSEGHEEER